ncbi:hypothetical protein BDR06DRAFT_1007679 [Suillus hirtellus]|nr:hypothetical protein BDR06DRAFT_1007679 [Suillus hirtellus]
MSSHLVDAATQTDAHSFTISQILIDAAVSTEDLGVGEDLGVSEVTTGLQVDEGWKALDRIPCIMGGLTALVASVGGTLCGRAQNNFPWRTLPKELARLGYFLINYPNETLMPGEIRPSLTRSKGIHDLTIPHRDNLVNALNDTARTRLIMSKDPIIIGEAPTHRSFHSHGQRAFTNGDFDQNGPPCLAAFPTIPLTCRRVEVFVEISRLPPRPASRAISCPPPWPASGAISRPPPWPVSRVVQSTRHSSLTHANDLIPPITAVEQSVLSSEYADDTDDESTSPDEQVHFRKSGRRPVKHPRY